MTEIDKIDKYWKTVEIINIKLIHVSFNYFFPYEMPPFMSRPLCFNRSKLINLFKEWHQRADSRTNLNPGYSVTPSAASEVSCLKVSWPMILPL